MKITGTGNYNTDCSIKIISTTIIFSSRCKPLETDASWGKLLLPNAHPN